ncbi:MAG TPA: hypothetical protein VJT73_06600 [Polyangiaceae bacterium]|nr:hypothetical protein [Polyangiaceae bacterium]
MRSLRWKGMALLALSATAALGCGGAGFDPQEKIKGLRILAVEKDKPYPAPGDDVELKLLYWDGKSTETDRRKIQVGFVTCAPNPPADLYYNCRPVLSSTSLQVGPQAAGAADAGTDAATGDSDADADAANGNAGGGGVGDSDHTHTYRVKIPAESDVPPNILHKAAEGPDYGLVYVLYAVCAGTLEFKPDQRTNEPPIGCVDGDKKLGPGDFVTGYTSIYVYRERRNANPILDDLKLNGISLKGSTALDEKDLPKVPRCKGGDCGLDIEVNVSEESAEPDPSAKNPDGRPLQEQIWAAYYTTSGGFKSSLRLVNDATTGRNTQQSTKYDVPSEPGPVRIWSVVHDNRGGVAWIEGRIMIVDMVDMIADRDL